MKNWVDKPNSTWFFQAVVNIDMLERVPGIFALLCAIEHQSHQVTWTADDLTGVNTAHDLHKNRNRTMTILKKKHQQLQYSK